MFGGGHVTLQSASVFQTLQCGHGGRNPTILGSSAGHPARREIGEGGGGTKSHQTDRHTHTHTLKSQGTSLFFFFIPALPLAWLSIKATGLSTAGGDD